MYYLIGNKPRKEKRVIFSDGIRPRDKVTDSTKPPTRLSNSRRSQKRAKKVSGKSDFHITLQLRLVFIFLWILLKHF